jgi:creatinine amidohydrolase
MTDLIDAQELRHGIHGGMVETSMMLHLHPELVDMQLARNFLSRSMVVEAENAVLRVEGATGIGWQTQDLNAAGVCGDATRATEALGRELVERAAQGLAALIADVDRYPPP